MYRLLVVALMLAACGSTPVPGSGGGEGATGGGGTASVGGGDAASGGGTASSGGGVASSGGGTASVGGGAASVGGGSASVGGGTASIGGGTASVGGGAATVGGGTASSGGGSASVGGGTASVGGGTASVGGGTASVGGGAATVGGGTASSGGGTASSGGGSASVGGGSATGGGAPVEPCVTRITYGSNWIHGPSHPNDYDDAAGVITWDGVCTPDGSGNSSATLSNGWKPYFTGNSGCIIALDQSGSCSPAPPANCQTRIGYGSTWMRAPNHPNDYDDVNDTVTWDGVCRASASNSAAQLSNGWAPNFTGAASCRVSLRYQSCGGLYANPSLDVDAPDPGVMKVGSTYYMATTGGRFALRRSNDLVNWTSIGFVRPTGQPAWAVSDFWAPELHAVNGGYVAYFSARKSNGAFALGTATASAPQGPYTPQTTPILEPPAPGAIDVHFFRSSAGQNYLLWKIDGNQTPGNATPIFIQPLSANGLTLTGTATQILDKGASWEGNLVEAPWMVEEGGYFYLFYSANGYASNNYAIGVARATSPTGPFTKHSGNPILKTRGAWAGPGHGSVLKGTRGEWVHIYHAWVAGQVGTSPGRQVLVDRVEFVNGWPQMLAAPSLGSQPLP